MAALSDFMPYVLPYVQGCTYPLAELHIRNICIDFCTHAPIVQERPDPIDVVAGQIEYDIDTASYTAATLILEAAYQLRPLAILKVGDINFEQAHQYQGEPRALMQSAQPTFTLDHTPAVDAPGAITMLVATKPTRMATNVADLLLNDYGFEIGQGVVGRLMMIPGHEWTNPAIAGAYTQIYERARTEARIRAEASFGQTGSRVMSRRFI
jgi:hypothetical protein